MKKISRSKKVVYALTVLFSVVYLVWRGMYTLPFHGSLFALLFGILLWISEIVSNFTGLILVWSKSKSKEIAKPEVPLEDYPDIDVLIATHNEEVDLLLKTVNAAVNIDYPDKSKVHIYLADDTNRLEVKELAAKFHIGHIGLENNRHAKSGNLNHALAQTSSPLVATFDADMIPYSDFLMETVPYFVENRQQLAAGENVKPLGLLQTPQSFYNADLFQYNLFSEASMTNEQDFFSREVNVLNNAHDAAIYTGSNTVITRQAIVDAGGFPTDTITEDFELGALINSQGYKNISTLEPMASGLTPTDIPSTLKQRIRWGRGVVQSVHNLHLLTNKRLSLQQKLIFLNSYLYWWSFIRRLLYILAPILFTVFGIQVVDTNFWTLLLLWLPSYFFLHLSMQDLASDIRTQRWGEVQETIFAPYLVMPVLMQAIGIKETKFKVTNKAATQSKKDLLYVLPHLILWILTVIGLVTFNYGKFGSEIFYGSVISFWLLNHLFNLTFAVLFFLGRPLYRKNERFLAEIPLKISYGGKEFDVMTKNISENGLSFAASTPYYFPDDAVLDFEITKGEYTAQLKGKIVRVFSGENEWDYGVALDEMPEQVYLNYLQIIYDGFNRSLPKFFDPWVTPFDRFFDNIHKRLLLKKTASNKVSKYAQLQLNEAVQLGDFTVILEKFDYQTMTFLSTENRAQQQIDVIEIEGVTFQLRFAEETGDGRYLYTVQNSSEWVNTTAFQQLLAKWVSKGDEDVAVDDFAY
ncbi:glycosyltransferase [Desemzia sp. FAM 24101]|uniref:glycosyltransferase n=1 Tax=unclassified Desemzia TaxID=2685243 RepID=UPI0038845384